MHRMIELICSFEIAVVHLLLISFFTVLFIGENLTENLQYQDIESPVVCHPNKQPKVVQELGQTASLRCRVSVFCIVLGYSWFLYILRSRVLSNKYRICRWLFAKCMQHLDRQYFWFSFKTAIYYQIFILIGQIHIQKMH